VTQLSGIFGKIWCKGNRLEFDTGQSD
jgi:hypothetical protein